MKAPDFSFSTQLLTANCSQDSEALTYTLGSHGLWCGMSTDSPGASLEDIGTSSACASTPLLQLHRMEQTAPHSPTVLHTGLGSRRNHDTEAQNA